MKVKFPVELSLRELFYLRGDIPLVVQGYLKDGSQISGVGLIRIFDRGN